MLSHVLLFVTPWIVAHQAPLSREFSRQEYWSGLSVSTPGDLPDPGMEPTSLASSALAGGFFTTALPGKPHKCICLAPSYQNITVLGYRDFKEMIKLEWGD